MIFRLVLIFLLVAGMWWVATTEWKLSLVTSTMITYFVDSWIAALGLRITFWIVERFQE